MARPSNFGSVAGLAGFFTGKIIAEQLSHTPETLADLDDRARKLQYGVCQPCRIFEPLYSGP